MRYPERFVGDERQVELSGEAYFDVVHDEKAPFIVKTSRSTITVLGTEFGVRDYEGKANLTTLVQGRVAVCDSMNKSYVIYPGQQVIIDERGTTVEDVETAYFYFMEGWLFLHLTKRLWVISWMNCPNGMILIVSLLMPR